MVELFEQDVREEARQSSKGNQLKWKKDDYWYKADYTGYEGLAEYMVSSLLEYSSLTRASMYCISRRRYTMARRAIQGAGAGIF